MIACIDIGGTAIKVGVLDLQGKIVEKTSLEVNHDFNGLINSLVSLKKLNNSIRLRELVLVHQALLIPRLAW